MQITKAINYQFRTHQPKGPFAKDQGQNKIEGLVKNGTVLTKTRNESHSLKSVETKAQV